VESKNIERLNCEKQLELLKTKQKSLQAEIKDVKGQIEESVNVSNMLEERYKNSVNFGKTTRPSLLLSRKMSQPS
jgi:hypothetical protein